MRNLADLGAWISGLVRRVERLESGAFLEKSSITNGRMRFIGGTLRVDSGGRVEIVGTLRVDGDWRFVGDGAITGDVVAEGRWTQNGDWEFNGEGDIAGDVEVTGDINVTGGGKIKAGDIILNPSSNGGAIQVGTHFIDGRAGSLGFYAFGHFVVLNNGGVSIVTASGKSVVLSASGIQFGGLPTVVSSLAGGAAVGTMWLNTSGQAYRVVAG